MYQPPAQSNVKTPSGGTAETLTLIGIILQLIFLLVWLLGAAVALAVAAVGGVSGIALAAVYFVLLLLGVFAFWWAWTKFYQPIKRAGYQEAKEHGILAVILGFIAGGIITGVLYLVAYLKLGDALNEQRAMAAGAMMGQPGYPGQPVYTAPGAAPPGAAPPGMVAGAAAGATAGAAAGTMAASASPPPAPGTPQPPTCPRCGKPGTWIPQYSRFYCYTDQQYL